MSGFWSAAGEAIVGFSDFICGYPLFILLIGGGLFFLVYSRFAPLRRYGSAIRALAVKDEGGSGQISSVEAFLSAIAATVGLGSIAGVAIALSVGGPGAVFWMWVSALAGMATKFFEGTLSVMYKGKDSAGEVQGGPMYMMVEGLGPKWRPAAILFCCAGLLGTLCVMQSNQLTEALLTVFPPERGENPEIRFFIGAAIALIVALVIFGGISRISKVATRLVPVMVGLYFLMILYIIFSHLSLVPEVFGSIFREAFRIDAAAGGVAGGIVHVALTGVRRATLVNEAGVGTASMMHGASRNSEPVREGLVAMLGPSIDSGLVCTITAVAILIGRAVAPGILPEGGGFGSVQGLRVALGAFDATIPAVGKYLLLVVVLCFSFSTMFSYSYYGRKCFGFLFGARRSHWYNWFFLVMLVIAAVVPLSVAVSLIDGAYALMAFPTMAALLLLAPKARRRMDLYFKTDSKNTPKI